MQRDGEEGRKKMTAITRYVTVGLALFESVAMAVGFGRQGLLTTFNAVNVIVVVAALTAGSAFLMWVGEQINDKGVGNGISIGPVNQHPFQNPAGYGNPLRNLRKRQNHRAWSADVDYHRCCDHRCCCAGTDPEWR